MKRVVRCSLYVVLGYVLGSIARIFGFLDECDEEMKDNEWG